MKNLVISVPRLEIHRPPISTAIISSVIKLHGHEVRAIDLNCEFFHYLSDIQAYYNFDEVWDRQRKPSWLELKNIVNFIKKIALPEIKKYDRLWISVFGGSGTIFTELLCKLIRKKYKDKIIVIGGQGVKSANLGEEKGFGYHMKKAGLCDLYIVGEGEHIVKDVLDGKLSGPGLSDENPAQVNELDDLPFPDYSFYDLDRYDYLSPNKEVFIVGSRGCVRRCTYCDVAKYWPKFRYRSGKNIASEMISHYEKHGVTDFYFTDSLINGSMKAFNYMCEELAKYNTQHKAGFKWKGQFIFRPKNQLPKDHFELVSLAGGKEFYVGVETGSDKIRWEMDKKFTNEDIDFQLEEFAKYDINVFFLMLIGYVTETNEDHKDTLKMFKRWQRYVATGTIKGIDLGTGLKIAPGTPLANMIDSHEIYFLNTKSNNLHGITDPLDTNLWQSRKNPDLDISERIRRRMETHEEAIKYNWPVWRGEQRLQSVKILTRNYINFLNNAEFVKTTKDNLNFFE